MFSRWKKAAAVLTVFILALSGCRSKEAEEAFTKEGFYFDTVIQIMAYGEKKEEAVSRCFELCDEIEHTFSRTREDSELYQVNHRTKNRVQVSEDLAYVVQEGLKFYQLSEGRFDITIAPVTSLWDFKSDDPQVPDEELIKKAAEKVDGSKVHVEGNTLVFDSSETMLDLGALVKGYAADKLKECLEEYGIQSAMINLGGNVMTLGNKPDGTAWSVGIQKPFAQRNEVITTVEAEDCSVVSSGVYERYFEQDGVLYYHILDASTGYPADSDLWQTTILSDSSLEGDGLSTVCMLLGYEKARELTDSMEGIEALFVLEDGQLAGE
ncbi:MAG: FAD:protein FMN transferase [Ruminococcus sp.]|jgi:thiamine biosynthesis lipoprotein